VRTGEKVLVYRATSPAEPAAQQEQPGAGERDAERDRRDHIRPEPVAQRQPGDVLGDPAHHQHGVEAIPRPVRAGQPEPLLVDLTEVDQRGTDLEFSARTM
jgi:hypothetical protein